MPKYLAVASYTSEGIKGLTKAGGVSRRTVVEKLLKSLGGHLEAFYFAFGENDAYLILDVPDNLTAAAISLAVAGAGATRMKTIELLTPEEIDQAMKKHVHYTPPGNG
ncbi:MAG: GYD domain-containing protein [Verrucomicrobia bacterium]|nr:GYD domain-containing protein [Verrucomicrobiota bacterium]MBV8414128.1 GYD domain-containing protein [Verrucomicrobiota bacterium]